MALGGLPPELPQPSGSRSHGADVLSPPPAPYRELPDPGWSAFLFPSGLASLHSAEPKTQPVQKSVSGSELCLKANPKPVSPTEHFIRPFLKGKPSCPLPGEVHQPLPRLQTGREKPGSWVASLSRCQGQASLCSELPIPWTITSQPMVCTSRSW